MKIKTRFFSEIEIAETEVIFFPFGIYGFEDYHRFVLIHDEEDEGGIFMWLQSVDTEDLCFIVIEPETIDTDYSPKFPNDILKKVCTESENDIRYIVMSVIRSDIKKSTVNMLSPIVLNPKKNVALQVVLDPSEPQNSKYKTKQELFAVIAANFSEESDDDTRKDAGIC